jgi:hypothetical protein
MMLLLTKTSVLGVSAVYCMVVTKRKSSPVCQRPARDVLLANRRAGVPLPALVARGPGGLCEA